MARLRLALLDAYPGSTWESERVIRRRWHRTGARIRHADAGRSRWSPWPPGVAAVWVQRGLAPALAARFSGPAGLPQ